MTTDAPRRGRPPYTPEQRTQASMDRLMRYTTRTDDDCWIATLKDVATAEGKRVRPAAFTWRVNKPDEPLQPGDTVRATCKRANCINLEHLVRIPAKTPWIESQDVSGVTVIAEPDTVTLTPDNTEKTLRWLIAKEDDPEMKEQQEQALAEFLARQADTV